MASALDQDLPLDEVRPRLSRVETHREAKQQAEIIDRLYMALRVLQWLATNPAMPTTLAEAVRWHATQGAFVDRARRHLLGAASPPRLADGITALRQRLQERRDAFNEHFATQLANWSKAPTSTSLLTVERFLDDVVCQLPAKRRALVVVFDGMDGGTFSELAEDIERRGWVRHATQDGIGNGGMLAVLPTVTEFSRTALLTGQLGPGDQQREKRHFSVHTGIAARSQVAPVLFHKKEISDDGVGGLSSAVRQAIEDGRCGVVGLVINAVDDHLAKSEQLRLRWNIDAFRILGPLLDAAESASRTVIFTADHGHMLEADAASMPGGDAERWRSTDAPAAAGEIEITGPRLVRGAGLERAVLLWTECKRYCQAKAGYHGGATLQEAVEPLAIYTRDIREMDGWQALPPATPDWWFTAEQAPGKSPAAPMPEKAEEPKRRGAAAERAAAHGQIGLFDDGSVKSAAVPSADSSTDGVVAASDTPAWLQALLESDVYAAQRKAAGPRAPTDARLETVLSALGRHANRLPEAMLARTLGIPTYRMRGLLAALRTVLNVDGFGILLVDDEAGLSAGERLVRLEYDLLIRQFEIDG